MTEVNPINPLDYFGTTELGTEYDFDHNGKVDIADYNYAIRTLEDEDPNNDVRFTKAQLDNAFEDLLKNAGTVETVTAGNAATIGNDIIAAINSGLNNPANATTLNQLQNMGKNLTKYIRQSAEVVQFLQAKIAELKTELDELDARKQAEEVRYEANANAVETKKEELASQMAAAVRESQSLSEEGEARVRQITATCVQEYKEGRHPDQNLGSLIESRLRSDNFDTSRLRSILNSAESTEHAINSLCSDLDTLTESIRGITAEYNAKNQEHNDTVTLRGNVLAASARASEQYQSGYAKRTALRQALVDEYKVTGNGNVTSDNPQLAKLANFLEQGKLEEMPYADAWYVLKNAFGQCGITFNDQTGVISVPYGHDTAAARIYNTLIQDIRDNYGVTASRREEETGYDDPDEPGEPIITRSDPMSFNVGDIEYSFINDNNNDGKFNDASEFLGAAKGWEEMKAFDTDGDGIIKGEELKKLNMVALNKKTGQYTFSTAADSGITQIDLNSYRQLNQQSENNDIKIGSFSVVMNGVTIQATQSDDTAKNLANNYSTLYGSEITDLSDTYKENPFMEEFVERVDTSHEKSAASFSVKQTTDQTSQTVSSAKHRAEAATDKEIADGVRSKEKADTQKQAQQQADEKKRPKEK